ncbi:MAG: hypothetical protein Q8R79_09310 [Legionellaceae bacterium]|nr:hypothetical protein [Legionellaceae bacterium]
MRIEQLYKLAGREEIDYAFITAALSNYACPREKISTWLKNKSLIRIKKGLYVFGDQIAQQPYSLEVLANLIYGPSAISLRYALAFHGLIPERVTTITCITNKRNKQFDTPVGPFTYRYLNNRRYAIGIELRSTVTGVSFLMASPEKALCDLIYLEDRALSIQSPQDIAAYLFQDLRLDEDILRQLNLKSLQQLVVQYQHSTLTQVIEFIMRYIKASS